MARKLKGLVAAVFAALLAVALVPSAAFAATAAKGSLTITNIAEGEDVYLYKVASTTVNDDNTISKSWVIDPADGKSVEDYEKADEAGRKAIANDIASKITADTKTVIHIPAGDMGYATIDNLDAGLYYAKVVNPDDSSVVYQNTLIPVNLEAQSDGTWAFAEPVSVALKKSDVAIQKKVSADNVNYGNSTDGVSTYSNVSNGIVYYKLVVTVPQYNSATGRTFSVTDVLPDGITLNATSVEVDDTAVTPTVKGQEMTVDLSAYLNKAEVTITYTANLTGTIVVKDGRTNTATLTFSANSYDTTTKTTSDTAVVNNGGVKVVKTNVAGDKKLEGAKFNLTDGYNAVMATGTTDANGELTFDVALASGTYKLVETAAPAGYKTVDPQDVIVDANKNAYVTVTVEDPEGTSGWLPSTGEAGTFGITMLGVLAVAGVAAMHVSGRKQN